MNIYSGYQIAKPPLTGTYKKYLSKSLNKKLKEQLSFLKSSNNATF